MSRKLKLELEPEYDFILVGIVSFERDYYLSWEINNKLEFDLVRTEDHSVKHRSSDTNRLFSCFTFYDENTYLNYKLLSNRSDNGYLLEQLKNIDYLVVVTGDYFADFAEAFKNRLRSLESVQSCFLLQPENIKDCYKVL